METVKLQTKFDETLDSLDEMEMGSKEHANACESMEALQRCILAAEKQKIDSRNNIWGHIVTVGSKLLEVGATVSIGLLSYAAYIWAIDQDMQGEERGEFHPRSAKIVDHLRPKR